MLAVHGLEKLAHDLAAAIGSMELHGSRFGKPELVEKSAREAERMFQGYAKASPSKDDAYAAAREFLHGQELSSWQQDLVAAAVAEPVREQDGAMVLGSERFPALLAAYEDEARRGDLWRLTWHGLLYSYFNFDPSITRDEATQKGWGALRTFLERTWPLIDQQAGSILVPDWIAVLRKEPNVLTATPADKYARAYLHGDSEATDQLQSDLGISPSSWFWHALVLGAVRSATKDSDAAFRGFVAQLLQLIENRPAFRDEALEEILIRYHACKGAPQNERLRDYVCQPTVWKNPKLKAANIATAWNRVPDPVWQMVLGWVNERNLKDFFDILAARNKADDGRLAFWSKYLKQITWTRLVFGSDTMALKRTNTAIRDLIAREEGAYAQLTGKTAVDAFMMQIGSYLIVEFSKRPNACYGYKVDELPFQPYAKYYNGGTRDLAAGYKKNNCVRIVHRDGWEAMAAEDLRKLGIQPDRPAGTSTTRHEPDMAALRALVGRFHNASISDKRDLLGGGGRLWVTDPAQQAQLATELEAIGFKWANSRQAWYLPET